MSDIAIPVAPGTRVNTLLDLVRRLALECGVSKDPVGEITTIINATEDIGRLVGWIITAWRDIQDLEPNWKFMRRSCSFLTLADHPSYTPLECGITANTFGRWDLDSFRTYLTAAGQNGELHLTRMGYDAWRDTYQFGAYRTVRQQPYRVTEFPDLSLGLGPLAPVGYTIIGDYYASPKDLAADNEVPALPDRHNLMIIVFKAMREYGQFEGAPEVYDRGEREYKKLLARLRMYELPPLCLGGSLA